MDAEEWDREQEADALLRAVGAFRRGSGIRGPRSLAMESARCLNWEEWLTCEVDALGSSVVWEEMDAIAAAARLSPLEKAVLSMSCIGEYSLREIARELGLSLHAVRVRRQSGMAKCARCADDHPSSARALFAAEVRDKQRAVYHRPRRPARSRVKKAPEPACAAGV